MRACRAGFTLIELLIFVIFVGCIFLGAALLLDGRAAAGWSFLGLGLAPFVFSAVCAFIDGAIAGHRASCDPAGEETCGALHRKGQVCLWAQRTVVGYRAARGLLEIVILEPEGFHCVQAEKPEVQLRMLRMAGVPQAAPAARVIEAILRWGGDDELRGVLFEAGLLSPRFDPDHPTWRPLPQRRAVYARSLALAWEKFTADRAAVVALACRLT